MWLSIQKIKTNDLELPLNHEFIHCYSRARQGQVLGARIVVDRIGIRSLAIYVA